MGWHVQRYGDCEYHVSTVAGGQVVGYVTLNDADEWIAATGEVHAGTVIGSGYQSPHHAKMAVDRALR